VIFSGVSRVLSQGGNLAEGAHCPATVGGPIAHTQKKVEMIVNPDVDFNF